MFQVAALEGVAEQAMRGRRRLNPNQGGLQQLLEQRLRHPSISGTTSGTITQDDVLELAYRHEAEDLSCDRAQWQGDLPIALALKLKLETSQASDSGVVAVYPRVGSLAGRVLRRRVEHRDENYGFGRDRTSPRTSLRPTPRTEWQIQLTDPSQTALWISLPENHASADVGLGTGQDNWWEAPRRPLWLDALEAAIASDSPTAWRQLEMHLTASQLSENSVRSVQKIITTLDALPPHDSRLPDALHPAPTDPKTARE
ncbi:MAG: hypothetical protein HC857_17640 [Synechococcales cyanobacterium RU_4_20]|nr:hypothetical protein [Synechococcales cyanobacterium RU_4_20]